MLFFLGPPPSRRKCLIMTKFSLSYCILRQGLVSRKGTIGNTGINKVHPDIGKWNCFNIKQTFWFCRCDGQKLRGPRMEHPRPLRFRNSILRAVNPCLTFVYDHNLKVSFAGHRVLPPGPPEASPPRYPAGQGTSHGQAGQCPSYFPAPGM